MGLALLEQMNRADPFAPARFKDAAEYYDRYEYLPRAATAYEYAFTAFPDRHDMKTDWGWVQVELGNDQDPQVAKVFIDGVRALRGNSSFHRRNLNFLIYHKKEYAAAKQWADFFIHHQGFEGFIYRAEVESELGDKEKAEAWLDKAENPGRQGLNNAIQYAKLSHAYSELGLYDKAEKVASKAERIDSWQANVMQARMTLAKERKQYDQALAIAADYTERYDAALDVFEARIYEEQGLVEKAITRLKEKAMQANHHQVGTNEAYHLLEIAAENDMKDLANDAMDQILRSTNRYRSNVKTAAEALAAVDPERSAEILDDLDNIMRERKYIGDPAPWEKEEVKSSEN